MRPVRWLLWVGLQVCLGPLSARGPAGGMTPVCHPVAPRRAEPPGHDHGYCRLLEWSASLGKAACTCPALPLLPNPAMAKERRRPGHRPGPGRNLVVEVLRIDLNDASGNPKGTFR